MRWALLTFALMSVTFLGATWVVLRDRTDGSVAAEREVALSAVRRLFVTGTGPPCSRCGGQLLERSAPQVWLVRLNGTRGTRCVTIDLDRFRPPVNGLRGVRAAPCPDDRDPRRTAP